MNRLRFWWIAAILPHAGCALFVKSDPFVSRYFSPESAATHADPVAPSALEMRLGRVNHTAIIKDRIEFRDSAYEDGT